MALINASSFGNLAAVSASTNQVQQTPTKFFTVFISSDDRGMMEGGRYHCPVSFKDDNSKFFVLNEKSVYFIPLYIKRYWTKINRIKVNGQDKDDLVDFGWNDSDKKPEGAKTEYIIAGFLWDNNNKTIVKHQENLEENKISAGESVLVYFKCKGIKCNSAFNLLKRIDEKVKQLESEKKISPLSDNPTFERTAINPRRFLIRADIKQSDPIHGRRFKIFDFYPESLLPNDLVLKILDASNNKFLDDFNKQFDKTDYIKNRNQNSETDGDETFVSDSTQKVDHVDVPDVSNDDPNPGEQFNIDL